MADWADALPAEDKTYLASKGWDKAEDATKAVSAILGSYKAAESKIGAPPDAFVKWPAGQEPPADVFKRLGVPEAADAYKFEGIEDAELTETLRNAAFANKLTPAQAQAVAASLTNTAKAKNDAAAAAATVTAQAEDIKLRAAWGGDYDVQMAITDRFLEKSGFTPAQKSAFTDTAAGRQLLYAIAYSDKEGSARGAGGHGPSGPAKMSPEEAAATLEARKADREWVKKWQGGDAAVIAEFNNLTTLMVTRRA